jgi:hypothetical protein
MSEFIFMLTHSDSTVGDAVDVYQQLDGLDLRWVGFKDVGVDHDVLHELTSRIHADGRKVALEVVSLDVGSELRSVRAGLAMGVDLLMGGTHPEEVLPLLRDSNILYFPFASDVVSHPSIVPGPVEAIVRSTHQRSRLRGVHGLDFLAYRFVGDDIPALLAHVLGAASVPVVVAGSIDTRERIQTVSDAGAWAFTVGSAVFDGAFPAETSVRGQVEYVLDVIGRPRQTVALT